MINSNTHYRPDRSKANWSRDIRQLHKPQATAPKEASWERKDSTAVRTRHGHRHTFSFFGVVLLLIAIGCLVALG